MDIMKTGKLAKIAVGTAAVLAFAGNTACDFAIKRPDPNKPKKPETREAYIKRNELRRKNNQYLYDHNPEDLTLKSVDGITMKAWFVPAESKRFVICVHGYRCNGPDEFSHMFPFYHDELGYNYLLPDLTGHGRSDGDYACFGATDAKNILLWVEYLINRFGEDIEIILHGISMGAATVMNVNEMSPPDQVKIVIEDCGFIGAAEGASLAQAALNAVMAANPIGIVVTAVAALVAALVTAYKTNDEFRAKVDAAWDAIKSKIQAVTDWIKARMDELREFFGLESGSVNLSFSGTASGGNRGGGFGSGSSGSFGGTVNNFRVDDIRTYQQIEQRAVNQQRTTRMGYAGG